VTGEFPPDFTVSNLLHQPFWCEENAWHLSAHAALSRHECLVAMVTGLRAGWRVRCHAQRAGGARGSIHGGVVDWDYHVLVFARAATPANRPAAVDAIATTATDVAPPLWRAFDPDSTLPFAGPATQWLDGTFPPGSSPLFSPLFRVFSGADYRRTFSSDRAHMRVGDGWSHPPPPWPPIGGHPPNLRDLLDPQRPAPGEVLDLAQLRARLAGGA
jgi:hypothetical protein